jgi:hypothetical protein
MEETAENWAILELMGHQKIAGRLTETDVAGVKMLKVEVPEVGIEIYDYDGSGVAKKVTRRALAFTRFLHPNSLYAINPCSQAQAVEAVKEGARASPLSWMAEVTGKRLPVAATFRLPESNPLADAMNEDQEALF